MAATKSGASIITESRLRLSRAPSADIAGAAWLAMQDAGLESAVGADFVVIALTPGVASDKLGEDLKKLAAAAEVPRSKPKT